MTEQEKIIAKEMVDIVMNRVNEMMKDREIIMKMIMFDTIEEGQDWIIKAAIATLMIPVSERIVIGLN